MTIINGPATIDSESIEDRQNRTQLAIGRKMDPPSSASTLNDADVARLRDHLPDDPVQLPPNKIACAGCGTAIDYPRTRAAIIRVPTFTPKANGSVGSHTGYVLLGRCPDCQDRRQLALRIAAGHPLAGQQLGNIVIDAVEHVLVALHVLGKPLPTPDCTDAELGSLIRTLGAAGRTATWQFIADQRSGRCSPRPFGWIRQDTRTVLTRSWIDHYAETMKMRRPPVAVPPPPASGSGIKINLGCLMCGVDHADVPALKVHRLGGPVAAAKDVWTTRESVNIGLIGGPSGPERISGHTCPQCDRAISSIGGVGPTAMEQALAKHLETGGLGDLARSIRLGDWRITAWAGLVARARQHGEPEPEANTEPWAHIRLPMPGSGAAGDLADHDTDPNMLEPW